MMEASRGEETTVAANATLQTGNGNNATGHVVSVAGTVVVLREGTRLLASADMALLPGDQIETGPDSAVGLILADETSLALGADSALALNAGSTELAFLGGELTVVSGDAARHEPGAMTIHTPVGEVALIGTQAGLLFSSANGLWMFLMQERDGFVGEVAIHTASGIGVINEVHHWFGVVDGVPGSPLPFDEQDLTTLFKRSLSHLPMTHGRENDYGLQMQLSEASDAADVADFLTAAGGTVEGTDGGGNINVVDGDYTGARSGPGSVTGFGLPDRDFGSDPEPDADAQNDEAAAIAEGSGTGGAAGGDPDVLNAAPVALPLAETGSEDGDVIGQLSATDDDLDSLTFALAADGGPTHGTVVISEDGSFIYTPEANYSGNDSFGYQVSDGQGGFDTATVDLSIAPVADAPQVTVADVAVTVAADGGQTVLGDGGDNTLTGGSGTDT